MIWPLRPLRAALAIGASSSLARRSANSSSANDKSAGEHDHAEREYGVAGDPRFADPADDERDEAQPEQEEQIGEQDLPLTRREARSMW